MYAKLIQCLYITNNSVYNRAVIIYFLIFFGILDFIWKIFKKQKQTIKYWKQFKNQSKTLVSIQICIRWLYTVNSHLIQITNKIQKIEKGIKLKEGKGSSTIMIKHALFSFKKMYVTNKETENHYTPTRDLCINKEVLINDMGRGPQNDRCS